MMLPAYGLMPTPARPGTEPLSEDSERKPGQGEGEGEGEGEG